LSKEEEARALRWIADHLDELSDDEIEALADLFDPELQAWEELAEPYRTDLVAYCREQLEMEPWAGVDGEPGQLELFQDISESVRLQLEGKPHQKVFHVQAGHGVGKTRGAAAVVNWYFDVFRSITITTAPSDDQVRLLLWKDIKTLRKGRNLPGKVLPEDPRMQKAEDWFAIGRTTSNSGGQGTARMQGQHPDYWLYVLDEAEGVADFVFGAVDGMMTGGAVGIVLMLANPQTRTSSFAKKGKQGGVRRYRFNCLKHPNVVTGQAVVPGAVMREWCVDKIANWCEVVDQHSEDDYTFTVPFAVDTQKHGIVYAPGTIFRPNSEFQFRVLGIAPANVADKVFVSPGRYEAACKRDPEGFTPDLAQIGIDCARYGKDAGTIYVHHKGVTTRHTQIYQGNTSAYVEPAIEAALKCQAAGATHLSIRVDGTGGFGAGAIDGLKADMRLRDAFGDNYSVHEVHFGSDPYADDKYADKVTELYAEAAETLKGIRIHRPSTELEVDLTERTFDFVNRSGKSVKKLDEKEKFRKKFGRSPDDGDGFVLAVAPEFIFADKSPFSHHIEYMRQMLSERTHQS